MLASTSVRIKGLDLDWVMHGGDRHGPWKAKPLRVPVVFRTYAGLSGFVGSRALTLRQGVPRPRPRPRKRVSRAIPIRSAAREAMTEMEVMLDQLKAAPVVQGKTSTATAAGRGQQGNRAGAFHQRRDREAGRAELVISPESSVAPRALS
jgi:hypothetical protein